MPLSPRFLMDLADEGVELCRSVAGADLAEREVYVVPFSWLDADWGHLIPCEALGATGYALDLELRELLQRRGVWKGRGFACVVREDRLYAFRALRGAMRLMFLGAVLHELAHHLCYDARWFVDQAEMATAFRAMLKERKLNAWPTSDPRAPWHGHEGHWIRAGLHLIHRARRRFLPIEPDDDAGIAGARYGLSKAEIYGFCLGTERWDYEELPIREILRKPMPAAFEGLFTADTQKG